VSSRNHSEHGLREEDGKEFLHVLCGKQGGDTIRATRALLISFLLIILIGIPRRRLGYPFLGL
jgi:hypothetical protein